MAADSWRYPWTLLPDYMGPGTPLTQYEQRRKALNTGNSLALPSLGEPPARTALAVQAGASQGDVRKTERGAYAPSTPAVPRGADYGTQGSTSPGGLPYLTTPTSVPGISRVNQRGQSPLFTNLESGAAVDDMARMRSSPLPSVAGFLKTVPEFGQGVRQAAVVPTNAAVSTQAPDPLAGLFSQAQGLLESSNLIDNWRGRMLMRAYERGSAARAQQQQADAASGAAGAQVLRAANEMPIAQLGAATQRRGQDLTAATMARGQDFTVAPHLPTMQITSDMVRAARAGDQETAQAISRLLHPPTIPAPHNPTVVFSPLGGMAIAGPGGVEYQTAEEMAAAAEKRKRAAAAKAILDARQ